MKRILLILAFAVIALAGCDSFNRSTLDNTIDEANHRLPKELFHGVQFQQISIDDDYVVYHYLINESQSSIDLSTGIEALAGHADIASGTANDPDMKKFISLIKKCNMGLKEHFVGDTSRQEVEITIIPAPEKQQ